jgi:thiamine-phosphate pyrophosphorylase
VRDRRQRLQQARLYLVCADIPQRALLDALRGGVDIVQLRLKDAGEQAILAAAARIAPLCAQHGALFILNDRPDLVCAAGADGVHVGQDDVPVAAARQAVGPDRLVGLSTHSAAQIEAAGRLPELDYIGVGPVHATPTKPGRAAVGLELVRYAADHAALPFFAIGGIDPGTVPAVRAAGAQRIAVVRAITESEAPGRVAATLRQALGTPGRPREERVGTPG